MKTIVVAGAMLAGSVFAAVPVIDPASISARQDGGHTVVIGYTMNPATDGDTDPAIITVDVLTNYTENAEVKWASIGGEHLTTLSGDVNKIVGHTADYKHNILWDPTKEGLPKLKFDANEVKVEITAWATNSPPAYWIIDLTHPADRTYDRYYPNAGQIPLGVTNVLYKTDRLVMRRIPAKGVTWRMGDSTTAGRRTIHYVTFSYDYWMAIYEFTKGQHSHVFAWGPSDKSSTYDPGEANRALPATGRAHTNWRTMDVPASHAGSGDTLIRGMRAKMGGLVVDLPTEAEWEFACRAGSSAAYCNGDTASDLGKVAWYNGSTLHDVGLKEPNSWGLYDMHGNAAEICLERLATRTADPVWDPMGPATSNFSSGLGGSYNTQSEVVKGGSWTSNHGTAELCKSGNNQGWMSGDFNGEKTIRLCLPIP